MTKREFISNLWTTKLFLPKPPEGLAQSIREDGMRNPIIVRMVNYGHTRVLLVVDGMPVWPV